MQQSKGGTVAVDDEIFRQVYDSPSSLPGKHAWLTPDEDVRAIEKLLGMPERTIGAPLWVSGDRMTCRRCDRQMSWLDIVSSGLAHVHSAELIAQVILGKQKFVNSEAPRAIAHVQCSGCGAPFDGLRSFKCHNWAYAVGAMREVVEQMRLARSAG